MSIERLVDLIHEPLAQADWPDANQKAFDGLFGSPDGRYPSSAKNTLALRAPKMTGDDAVAFSAFIHPSNPTSGAYSGMSIAIFPTADPPALMTFVVGTAGLLPDDGILGRPGHARKVQAICAWLNRKYGSGKVVAWAKQEPTRTDQAVPDNVATAFDQYQSVFERYGNVIYGLYAPTADRAATREALTAFLDLMIEERGGQTLKPHRDDEGRIRAEWFAHLMPNQIEADVTALLQHRKYVVIQGPPGTGKTRMADVLLRDNYQANGFAIQFHPNTTYESFVGGLAPATTSEGFGLAFAPTPGYLMTAAKRALDSPERAFLLTIDEINRADLGKVLGEAIYLLEPGEQREIDLPHDFGAPFGRKLALPPNLHILGTMNTADRSLAAIDVAVRRRFAFVKLWPQIEVVQRHSGELMQTAFARLLSIFVEHASGEALDLLPGHSYFLEKPGVTPELQLKVTLAPLLEEYVNQGYVSGFAEEIRSYLQWIEGL